MKASLQKASEEQIKEIDRIAEKLKSILKDENPNICITVITFFLARHSYKFSCKENLFKIIEDVWKHIENEENPKNKIGFFEKITNFLCGEKE
jgi:hypothetical protein